MTESAGFSVRVPHSDAEIDAYAVHVGNAFAFPVSEARDWILNHFGVANTRVLLSGDEVVGGLTLIQQGQYFGAKALRAANVAGVVVAPHVRGRGAARALMGGMLAERRAAGTLVSSLYPSTLHVYRSAGYEVAGLRHELRFRVGELHTWPGDCASIRPIRASDQSAVHAVYARAVRSDNGPLDRAAYNWQRIVDWRGKQATGYVAERDGAAEGYVYMTQTREGRPVITLEIRDLCAATPEAARALWRFIAGHRSVAPLAIWQTAAHHPALAMLDERCYEATLTEQWMLRLIHVDDALTARGYPAGVTAELHLDVRDALLPANAGRRILRVAGGSAQVTEGGSGAMTIDVRGLAALFAGFRSAEQLERMGLASAAPSALAAASAVFMSAGAPWMADYF